MANLDSSYEPEDRCRAIIDYGSGTLIALAGPGTGKTSSLRRRVRELVLNRGVEAASIAYITFIRQISKKFEKDLKKELNDEEFIPKMLISTLHGVALGLIRNMGKEIGKTGHQEPLAIDSDKDLLVRKVQEDMRWLLAKRGMRIHLRHLRADLRKAKEQWQKGNQEPELSKRAQIALDAFSRLAHIYKVLDWDQTIIYANEICERIPQLPPWIGRVKHFLIDEYQDFNPSEQDFLDYIMREAESIIITGDDDQSLYSGRGASPDRIVALAEDGELDHVSLRYSWRCAAGIIEPANRFLRWMRDNPRELQTLREGGEVVVRSFKSAKEETEYLAARIAELLESIPESAHQEDGVACLFSTKPALSRYKTVLEERGIRCKVPKIVEATDQLEWARILLRLAHLGSQPLLERALLAMFPPMKPRHQRAVVKMLLERRCTVGEAVIQCLKNGKWSDGAVEAGANYQQLMASLTSGDPDRISGCLTRIPGGPVECSPVRIERFLQEAKTNLEDAVDSLLQQVFGPDEGTDKPSVSKDVELYTMQGAKGLTRRCIILPGCEKLWEALGELREVEIAIPGNYSNEGFRGVEDATVAIPVTERAPPRVRMEGTPAHVHEGEQSATRLPSPVQCGFPR